MTLIKSYRGLLALLLTLGAFTSTFSLVASSSPAYAAGSCTVVATTDPFLKGENLQNALDAASCTSIQLQQGTYEGPGSFFP